MPGRYVSTTSAINRGLRAEADSKARLPRLNYSDRPPQRGESRMQEDIDIERDKGRGYARRGELLVRKHVGKSAPAFSEQHAIMADVLRTRKAKARSRQTEANYNEESSYVGEAESGMRRAGGRQRSMPIRKPATTKDVDTVNGHLKKNFGRDIFIEDEQADQDLHKPLPAVQPNVEPVQDENIASSDNGRLAAVRERRPAGVFTKEDYEDLYPLLSTLQLAESTPGSSALRDQAQTQLSKIIDTLNAKSARVSDTVHLLRDVVGPHTTIASEEDKEKDVLWTRHRIRPRNMPKSILWFDRETGFVELITRDSSASINRAWSKQAKETLEAQKEANKMKANRGDGAISIITMRSLLTHCRQLLQRIQEAQKTKSAPEGLTQEAPVETMVAELSDLVTNLNKDCAEKEEVQSNDVRKALVTVLGLPGKLWTKAHPDGRKTMLFFDEAQGTVRVLLQQPQNSKTNGPTEHVSDASEKQSIPERKTPREKFVQKVRDLLDRCRRILETIHGAEQHDTAVSRRTRPTSRLEDKVVALVAQVNMLIDERHVEWAAVMFAARRELGKQNKFWTIAPPNGTQTMIWVKEGEGRLEVVRKTKSPSSEEAAEAAEAVRERIHPDDLPSTRRSSSYEPAASQSKVGEQSERSGLPERLRVQDGRTTMGTSSGRLKANSFPDDMPISIPHTTAASTFMYGSNAVLACLSAKKRQCYHLYINRPATKGLSDKKNGDKDKKNLEQIEQLALTAQIPITTDANIALLDRMSNRRPHNGVVLETSQVPAPPVLGLGKPDLSLSMMPVVLDRQNAEEVRVNGAPTALPTLTKTWRHPFILMLDGILDEGNMGNIIRTAYFYGVDAVAVSKNTCASVNSAIVSKASSGAIEAVQILSLPQPSKFVYNSLLASWRVYAAVAPALNNNIPANENEKYLTHSAVAAASPLRDHPCILMLGAEGEGLRDNLKNRADYFVSIEQRERGSMPGGLLPGIGVDSMNVASAAGVLVESFMRKPAGALPLGIESALGF